jgi:hypothetical protein
MLLLCCFMMPVVGFVEIPLIERAFIEQASKLVLRQRITGSGFLFQFC